MRPPSPDDFAIARFNHDEFAAAVASCCHAYLEHGDDDLSVMRAEMEVEEGWGTLDPAFWANWLAALWTPRGLALDEGAWGMQAVRVGNAHVMADVLGGVNTRFQVDAAAALQNPTVASVSERGALEGFTWLVDALLPRSLTVSHFLERLETSQRLIEEAFSHAQEATRRGLGNTWAK